MTLKLIGTSHISPESLKTVEETILKEEPDIVAVELDRKRLYALLHPRKHKPRIADIKRVGLKGWLFAQIGSWVEKKLGAKVGVMPGAEMLTAIKTAQHVKAKIALIDQDIDLTLRKFSKALTWKEKWRMLVDLLKGIFLRKGVQFDLRKVPPRKLIAKLLKDVKKRYPNIYRVLVKERNEVMAKNLARLQHDHPDAAILAVVGAGHEDDIKALVKKYKKKLAEKNKQEKR